MALRELMSESVALPLMVLIHQSPLPNMTCLSLQLRENAPRFIRELGCQFSCNRFLERLFGFGILFEFVVSHSEIVQPLGIRTVTGDTEFKKRDRLRIVAATIKNKP